MTAPAPLASLAPRGGPAPSADQLLEGFLEHVSRLGLTLYPAQEEAILELFEGKHVVLSTPTGSGKSLVALALHFAAFSSGRTSYYTSPIKALVNEKFFALCEAFGPDNVALMTGDASINRDAPIVCCTAEILASLALREGEKARVDAVVMDEFHYYADQERGWAWQVPLLVFKGAQQLLLSATLGDTANIQAQVRDFTQRDVARVHHAQRPVPLEFSWRVTPLHETITELVHTGKAPVYLVSFTQRSAAEEAQNLTSVNLCTKDEKEAIKEALRDVRFDTPYGKELQRFLRHGVGLHHAGLLPKYRRLVERLAQQNLLKVISGTDTLGVGVNIPLRTVLFTQLCKFDGEKTVILSARDFHQIAGRAGRKGFDDRGWVVAQAPEHVIENLALEAKAAAGKKNIVKKKPPQKGYVHFDEQTFLRLQEKQPETLESRFEPTHGMLLSLLQSDGRTGYRRMLELVARSHGTPGLKRKQKRLSAVLLRSLRHANIVRVVPQFDAWPRTRRGSALEVDPGLQRDFSLHTTLSLWLLDALPRLDAASPTHALDVLSLVEATLENPKVVLAAQVHRAKGEKIQELKAQGMEYDERMEELEKVEHPKPLADFVYGTFDTFREHHPWVRAENVKPKGIARELFETGATFNEYVRDYGLERSEGVLLRYLTDAWKTLQQGVPEASRTDELLEVLAFLRGTLAAVDSSLVDEWEAMRDPSAILARVRHEPAPVRVKDPAADPRTFTARIRAELHRLVRALARGDFDEARAAMHDPDGAWTSESFESALAGFTADHGGFDQTPRARAAHLTTVKEVAPRLWDVHHTLLARDGDDLWMLDGEIDLRDEMEREGPLLRLRRIGT